MRSIIWLFDYGPITCPDNWLGPGVASLQTVQRRDRSSQILIVSGDLREATRMQRWKRRRILVQRRTEPAVRIRLGPILSVATEVLRT